MHVEERERLLFAGLELGESAHAIGRVQHGVQPIDERVGSA